MKFLPNSRAKTIFVRIAWRSSFTGAEGHGEWFDRSERIDFEARIRILNHEHPGFNHRLEYWNRRNN